MTANKRDSGVDSVYSHIRLESKYLVFTNRHKLLFSQHLFSFPPYALCVLISRIPSGVDSDVTEIKQSGDMCMDTLGHASGETIGLYKCHKSGGNQVNFNIRLLNLPSIDSLVQCITVI